MFYYADNLHFFRYQFIFYGRDVHYRQFCELRQKTNGFLLHFFIFFGPKILEINIGSKLIWIECLISFQVAKPIGNARFAYMELNN